jgi:hypothetical protein
MRYKHWRYIIRYRFVGFFQRAWRGWSDGDTWSYDHYLARTIAPALRHMADHTNGYPMFIVDGRPDLLDAEGIPKDAECLEAWKHWLIEKATWFEWYHAEELNLHPDMNDDQKIAALDLYERQHKNFQENVLADFGRHFESLWD